MGYKCPFCQQNMSLDSGSYANYKVTFYDAAKISNTTLTAPGAKALTASPRPEEIRIHFYRCPNSLCGKTSIRLIGVGADVKDIKLPVYPISEAIIFPKYIPEQIRQDYEEAYAIAHLSPKASATLSRRCLQDMIRDFYDIKDKQNLYEEIEALDSIVPATQKAVLHSFRNIGNVGAHSEKDVNCIVDVEPENAIKLLKYLEILLQQWYLARHDIEELECDINGVANDIKGKKVTSPPPSE